MQAGVHLASILAFALLFSGSAAAQSPNIIGKTIARLDSAMGYFIAESGRTHICANAIPGQESSGLPCPLSGPHNFSLYQLKPVTLGDTQAMLFNRWYSEKSYSATSGAQPNPALQYHVLDTAHARHYTLPDQDEVPQHYLLFPVLYVGTRYGNMKDSLTLEQDIMRDINIYRGRKERNFSQTGRFVLYIKYQKDTLADQVRFYIGTALLSASTWEHSPAPKDSLPTLLDHYYLTSGTRFQALISPLLK